ncbi:cysteine desulfurase family protein [Paenibacillus lignilyticus]|uniref:Cysteine desulfurase n=1 Tax=Paenibacillus lignilyticus TaxID=1172615 RepID=A0ABS5CEK7_9BACL|nr:cysteine desulfurase family protein [Paenibacillus lignilyticus]MBP3964212.1 cysteine desulfurase [Paenibacillus lignilyticus]
MYYFDHCASTPPHEEVIRTMAEVMAKHYANPSSLHRSGQEAGKLLERARGAIASLFPGTDAKEWIFTSSATESNNIAIMGAARSRKKRGNHLITTVVEHPSVYDTFQALEREGFQVTYLPVDSFGVVAVSDLEAALTDETVLVSVMHVNNEVGAIQPIAEIGKLLKRHRSVLFHVDGVQSVGKLTVDLTGWGIDMFSASAHKVNGPRGVGLLYVRQGVTLEPLLRGGSQEHGLRPGTENVPAIVASAKAFRLAVESGAARAERMYKLKARLIACIQAIPELHINGSTDCKLGSYAAPHILHFSYPGMKPEVIIHMLEKQEIMASTKSACSSKSEEPSRVLLAMQASYESAVSGIRISFGDEHGEAELDWLCRKVRLVVQQLKPLERKG